LLRAPQRYALAVGWQKATYATLTETYEAAVARSPRLAASVDRLRQAESAYTDVCARHQADKHSLEARLTEHTSHMAKLSDDIKSTEKRIVMLEEKATAQGKQTLNEGGGCASAIVAAVLAGILGSTANSMGSVVALFFVFATIGLVITYQIGYGKNQEDRTRASAELENLRTSNDNALERNADLRRILSEHLNMAPDIIAKNVPIAAWSPILSSDFDEQKSSLVVGAPATSNSATLSAGTSIANAAGA